MAEKFQIVCVKCGSEAVHFTLSDMCPDDHYSHVALCCEHCGEHSSVGDWSKANRSMLRDERRLYAVY